MIILMNMKEFTGLTHQQVQEKIAQGLTNNFTANTSTSTWQIIKRNVFTLFNALNFAIALHSLLYKHGATWFSLLLSVLMPSLVS